MKLTLKKLTRNVKKISDPNKDLFTGFFNELKKRKICPEEFFRAIDKSSSGKIKIEVFIDEILSRKIIANRLQANRLAFMIDENLSGEITLIELQNLIASY